MLFTDLWQFFSLNTLPNTSVVFLLFFQFCIFDSFYHYAACWVTLNPVTHGSVTLCNKMLSKKSGKIRPKINAKMDKIPEPATQGSVLRLLK